MLLQGSHHPSEMLSKTLMFQINSNKAAQRKQSSEGGQTGVPWCLDSLRVQSLRQLNLSICVTYDDAGNQTSCTC